MKNILNSLETKTLHFFWNVLNFYCENDEQLICCKWILPVLKLKRHKFDFIMSVIILKITFERNNPIADNKIVNFANIEICRLMIALLYYINAVYNSFELYCGSSGVFNQIISSLNCTNDQGCKSVFTLNSHNYQLVRL